MCARRLLILLFILVTQLSLVGAVFAQEDAPPANCINVQQDGGFETPNAWQFTKTVSPGFLDATVSHSGQHSAFIGIPADAENQEADSTVWQKMQLPSAKQITATFWLRTQAGNADDKQYIVVWDLALDESTVLLYEQPTAEDWREISLDLSPFAGREILFIVGVHNDGAAQKAGAWVDDVQVTACGLNATPSDATDAPATKTSPIDTPTPTDAPTPTPSSSSTPTDTPTASPTAKSTPTATWTPTSTPPPTPTATAISIQDSPAPVRSRGGLPDNSALPLLAGVFLSGLVAIGVVIISLRH